MNASCDEAYAKRQWNRTLNQIKHAVCEIISCPGKLVIVDCLGCQELGADGVWLQQLASVDMVPNITWEPNVQGSTVGHRPRRLRRPRRRSFGNGRQV